MKLLDYQGLSHFWDNIDDIKQDKLTIDTELDATSHNPVENMAIKFEIDQLATRIDDGDDVNTYLYELFKGLVPYGDGQGTNPNDYISTCYCLVHGLVATIYFDIIGNRGAQQFALTNKIPEGCTPFKGITHLVAQSQSEFNNISIGTDGQIIITSNNSKFDTHCAITYLIKPSIIDPDNPDPLPSEEAQYTNSARLIKIGSYFPTVSGNTIGGQTMRGAALMTDVNGEIWSGYEGNYTVYLANGYTTSPGGAESFYWNKKYTNTVVSELNDRGYLYTFNECFEAANGAITETDLINKGIEVVEELAENEEVIQYFVTGFGKNSWVGGVNTPHNAQIKDKAYGGTSGAGDYNGRFYWTQNVLAHVFRFVPVSAEQQVIDKSHPVERSGNIIGYIDKIIPLKLIDTAYSWAGFTVSGGSTWRAPKLISTQESLATLHDTFEAQLVFEDWNNSNITGNKFPSANSRYYQRIDAKLVEKQTSGSSESSEYVPSWLSNLPDYKQIVSDYIASHCEAQLYNGYIDMAFKTANDEIFVGRFQPFADVSEDSEACPYDPALYPFSGDASVEGQLSLTDPEGFINGGAYAGVIYKYNNIQGNWELIVDSTSGGLVDISDIDSTYQPTEGCVCKVGGDIQYDFTEFVNGYYPIQPVSGGGSTVISSIEQEYIQVRPGKNWAKTSYRLQTYSGSEFN